MLGQIALNNYLYKMQFLPTSENRYILAIIHSYRSKKSYQRPLRKKDNTKALPKIHTGDKIREKKKIKETVESKGGRGVGETRRFAPRE